MFAVNNSNQAMYSGALTVPLRGIGNVLQQKYNYKWINRKQQARELIIEFLHNDQIRRFWVEKELLS